MESAGVDPLHTALSQQGVMLGQQSQQLHATAREITSLNTQMADLSIRVAHLQTGASERSHGRHEPEPYARNHPIYDGDPRSCQAFLSQCALVIALQPRCYAAEETKVTYVRTLLSGRAKEWGVAVWNAKAPFCTFFEGFRKEMEKLFDHSVRGDEATALLSRLTQEGSVTDYAIRLRTRAAACDWTDSALRARFLGGLKPAVAYALAALDLPADLESLINLTLCIESRLHLRQTRRRTLTFQQPQHVQTHSTTTTSALSLEPMQLGRLRLTPQQKQLRLKHGICLYCGKPGHFVLQCPLKAAAHQ